MNIDSSVGRGARHSECPCERQPRNGRVGVYELFALRTQASVGYTAEPRAVRCRLRSRGNSFIGHPDASALLPYLESSVSFRSGRRTTKRAVLLPASTRRDYKQRLPADRDLYLYLLDLRSIEAFGSHLRPTWENVNAWRSSMTVRWAPFPSPSRGGQ